MQTDKSVEERYNEYLQTLPLSDLRLLGRLQGVRAATQLKKEELVAQIIDVLTGVASPVQKDGRGAPPKQSYLNPEIALILSKIRKEGDERRKNKTLFEVDADEEVQGATFDEPVYAGILEIISGGYGFLRTQNCQPTNGADVFVPAPFIHSMQLREGDFVACTARPSLKNDSAAIDRVLSVNGHGVGKYEKRPYFDALTAQFPDKKIAFSQNNNSLALRVLDLFVPIGKGQRGLIIAPPKAGKTTLLKEIARSVAENYKDVCLIVLLIDERPEEVTDFKRSVNGAQVISSTFDEGADHHIRAAQLTIEHAKRLAEAGQDVIILLDSLTKLTRAYNHVAEPTGKTLTGGLDAGAFAEPKRFFGTARNTVEGGSITILATALVETGSRMDDVIYEEFKGTGNADIFLSRELAERRIFPAVDIRKSGTRKEELLLSKEELSAVYEMRARGLSDNVAGVLDMLRKTESNDEFISRLPEWLKVYRS